MGFNNWIWLKGNDGDDILGIGDDDQLEGWPADSLGYSVSLSNDGNTIALEHIKKVVMIRVK